MWGRVRSAIVAAACAVAAILICALWQSRWGDIRHCVVPPGDWSIFPERAEAQRYFTAPELGSPSHLAFWEDHEVYPACLAARRVEHDSRAGELGALLAELGERDLRAENGEVLRVFVRGQVTTQRDLYEVRPNAKPPMVRRLQRIWEPPARPFSELSESEKAAAFSEDRFRWVEEEKPISRALARRIWSLQRRVQPIPEGYLGYDHATWMLIETMDQGKRSARVVMMDNAPGAEDLQCELQSIFGDAPLTCAGDALN